MIPWEHLTAALDELELIRGQLTEARSQERTARFHHLLRTRQIGARHGEHIANVIELSEGWTVVHWLHDQKAVSLYSSSLSMRRALGVGTVDGSVTLSLIDASERSVHGSRRAQVREKMSPNVRQCLIWLGHGLSNAQIGQQLNLSSSTVHNLLSRGYKVLNVHTRIQAALIVRDLDLSGD